MGLWQTTDQIEAGLANLKSKTSRLKALKTQLDFRKKVLQQTHPNKVIFQFSHQGRHFTVDEMKGNLSQLLPDKEQTRGQRSPVIGTSNLTGRQIQHRWIVEGESEWFLGTILDKVAADVSAGSWYNIKYEGEDQIVTLDINKDIESGDIVLL